MALLHRITLIAMSVATLAFGMVTLASSPSYAGSVAPAPTLTSPANETDTAIKDLVLHWKPVEGANQYEVEISRNIDYTNAAIVDLPNGGRTVATLFEVPLGLPHSTYFWRVRARVNGTPGHWSASWSFFREWESLIHIVQTPSSTNPTLAWAPVPDASEYHVIFSPQPISADDILNSAQGCFTGNTSFTPGVGGTTVTPFVCADPALTPGTKYYWAIAALDDTQPRSELLLDNTLLEKTCGSEEPECDASYIDGASFIWQAPTGATNQLLTGLTTSWHSDTATQNVCGATTVCPMTPTFSWTPVQGSDVYFVRVYLDRDATTLYRDYFTQTPTVTPPDQFQDGQPGRPYYWQVEAATCGGPGVQCTAPAAANQGCPAPTASSGSSSSARPATAARPAATPSPSPTTTPVIPTVTGVSVSPAGPEGNQSMQGGTIASVTIAGSNIASGACVIPSGGVVTSAPSVTASSMTFNYWAPVDGGSITFQVENPDGHTSNPSPAIQVDSSATALALSAINIFQKRSGPVTLTSPANAAIKHGNTITFKWNDYIASGSQGSYDPENYEIQVGTDPSFSTTLIDNKSIDLTQYTPPTATLPDGHYYWRVNAIDEGLNLLTWSEPRELTITSNNPTVSFADPGGRGLNKPLNIVFSRPVKNVTSSTLRVVPDGESTSQAVIGKIALAGSPTQYTFTPKRPFAVGGTYNLSVSPSVVDANGNPAVVTGAPSRVKLVANTHSVGWTYTRGWHRHRASGSLSGQYIEAAAGHTASIRVAGKAGEIFGCKGPGMGSLSITLKGQTQTVSEKQSFTRCGVVLWHHALPAGESKLKITVNSGHGDFDEVQVT